GDLHGDRPVPVRGARRGLRGGADRARDGGAGDPAVNRPAERGSVSIEVAVLAPAFIALMVLAGVAGRSAVAAEAVDAAAHDAARAASISRNATDGEKEARNAAQQQLDWHGLNCADTPTLNFEGSVGGKITSFKDAYGSALGE